LGAQSQKTLTVTDTVARCYQILGADCGLFPAAARLLTDEDGNTPPHTGRFAPTQMQVTYIEYALRTLPLQYVPTLLGQAIKPRYPALIHQNLSRYKRQYFGFYNVQRHDCLYVHFFAEPLGYTPRWLREAIQVQDGGAGFWSIKYDWTTRQFYDFEHNSEG